MPDDIPVPPVMRMRYFYREKAFKVLIYCNMDMVWAN
jgi:hypothetical protein